jgi:hypothetical protein
MSENNIRHLTPISSVDESVVARIEEMLEMAKQGEILGFAAITINTNNEIAECYCGSVSTNVYKTIGALEALKYRIIQERIECYQKEF